MKRKREASVQRQLNVGAASIPYTLTLANRKSIGITIRADLRVEVRAPRDSSAATIEEVLQQRAGWIVRHLERFAAQTPALTLTHTQTHTGHARSYLVLGQHLPLTLHPSAANGSRRDAVALDDEGHLQVWVKDVQDSARVAQVLERWSRQQAAAVFAQRMAALMPVFEASLPRQPQLKIRRMRARWGSCSSSGTITLNLKLIHLDVALIDYVIMHELCHLIEHNHSKRFYALLTRMMPDWRARRDRLNASGMPVSEQA